MPGSAFARLLPAIYLTVDTEITETAGGTEKVAPVITLTCAETLTAATVSIENETTVETIEWTGDLVSGDVLEIDCQDQIVKLNGVVSMTTVSGQFPRLLPGANTIHVTGFSGSLNFTYRPRFV